MSLHIRETQICALSVNGGNGPRGMLLPCHSSVGESTFNRHSPAAMDAFTNLHINAIYTPSMDISKATQ